MRRLTRGCIAVVALLFVTSSASAWAVSMTVRGPTTSLTVSDTVTVDVFLDKDAGATIFSVAVINSNPSVLLYDGPASAALPLHPSTATAGCFFGGCTGAQPSYLLYTAGRAGGMVLYPLNTPYFLTFPPEFAGTEQVNVTLRKG